jgi:hypothetical protein
MGVVAVGLGFQTEEIVKERKGRRNSKESFVKMNKNREMEDSIGSKMVQANLKITKKVRKPEAGRQSLTRIKETKRTISLGPRVGTQCWPRVFQSANSLSWIRLSLTCLHNWSFIMVGAG